jgi:hypothetical protein
MSRISASFFFALCTPLSAITPDRWNNLRCMRVGSRILLLQVLIGFLFFSSFADAQVQPGYPSFSAFDSHEVDTVDLMNNNILLNVPVMSKSGAFPLSAAIKGNFYVYVSGSSWELGTGSSLVPSPLSLLANNFLFAGYSALPATSVTAYCPGGTTLTTRFSNWYILTADGTTHWLPSSDSSLESPCATSFTDTTTDGSGFTLSVTGGGLTSLYTRDGSSLSPGGFGTSITDSNGNTLSTTGDYVLWKLKDTMGLEALSYGEPPDQPWVASWEDVNGNTREVSITNTSTNVETAFGCTSPSIAEINTTGVYLPTNISFPDTTSIGITYEGTPGHSGNYTGRLNVLTLREGGRITYSYLGSNNGINCTYQTVPELQRVTSDGTTTYTLAYSLIAGTNYKATNTVVDGGGNATVYTFTGFTAAGYSPTYAQALTEVQHYLGPVSPSNLLTTDVYCYNTVFSSCSFTGAPIGLVVSPVTKIVVMHQINGM